MIMIMIMIIIIIINNKLVDNVLLVYKCLHLVHLYAHTHIPLGEPLVFHKRIEVSRVDPS